MLDELDVWFIDTRNYERRLRKSEWQSLINDFQTAAATRGARLTAASPSTDRLITALHPKLGRDWDARQACLHTSAAARRELGSTRATTAAFDDLVESLESPETSQSEVMARLQAFSVTFRCADRALVNFASQLAGVSDNSAVDVALVRHDLEGTDLPTEWPAPDEGAGLSIPERLDLARQLIAQPTPNGHHVIWITYGNARFDPWRFEMGPVTFYDGPAMLSCFNEMREDPLAGHAGNLAVDGRPYGLPPEIVNPESGYYLRQDLRWPRDAHWVAARIDLGGENYSDPVQVARDQADALVSLAAFHHGRSVWKPLQGHLHIVDGVFWSGSGPFENPADRGQSIAPDHTAEALRDLREDLKPHLPVDDPALRELINAATVINTAAIRNDSTELVQSVRTIEFIATHCDIEWQTFLTSYLATGWAQSELHHDIYRSAANLSNDLTLRRHFPELGDLHSRILRSDPTRSRGVIARFDIALAALPELAGKLPHHDQYSRTVRTTHRHTESTEAVNGCITDLIDEFGRLVLRLLRCRNSLTHGGPINVETVSTIAPFARNQASTAIAIALSGALSGQAVNVALSDYRDRKEHWRIAALTAPTPMEAIFEPR